MPAWAQRKRRVDERESEMGKRPKSKRRRINTERVRAARAEESRQLVLGVQRLQLTADGASPRAELTPKRRSDGGTEGCCAGQAPQAVSRGEPALRRCAKARPCGTFDIGAQPISSPRCITLAGRMIARPQRPRAWCRRQRTWRTNYFCCGSKWSWNGRGGKPSCKEACSLSVHMRAHARRAEKVHACSCSQRTSLTPACKHACNRASAQNGSLWKSGATGPLRRKGGPGSATGSPAAKDRSSPQEQQGSPGPASTSAPPSARSLGSRGASGSGAGDSSVPAEMLLAAGRLPSGGRSSGNGGSLGSWQGQLMQEAKGPPPGGVSATAVAPARRPSPAAANVLSVHQVSVPSRATLAESG